MKVCVLLLFATFPISANADQRDLIWAVVPAQKNASFSDGIEITEPVSENVVKIVGVVKTVERQNTPILSYSISGFATDDAPEDHRKGSGELGIPSNAYWPNADGTIEIVPRVGRGSFGLTRSRNPWEGQVEKKSPEDGAIISCGGVIVGGSGGSIAILNGRIVKLGNTIDDFEVAMVLPTGVVLDRNGSRFVVPLGRRITIRNTEG